VPKRDNAYMLLQRDRILAATLREFAARGFHRASMRDVAKRLRVSVGTLYVHFKNKDELFQGLLDRHASQFPGMRTASLVQLREYIRQAWSKPVDADWRRLSAISAHMHSDAISDPRVMRRLESIAGSNLELFEGAIGRDPQLVRLPVAKRRMLARRLLYWWSGVTYYRSDKLGANSRKLLRDLDAGFDLLIADALRE
jgi:AcrR family transcriptional regulator